MPLGIVKFFRLMQNQRLHHSLTERPKERHVAVSLTLIPALTVNVAAALD